MPANKIVTECGKLQGAWAQRNIQMKAWYELITMVDKLKEQKMESFCSNEPRTFFNLALHLLTPAVLTPRIPLNGLEPEDIADVNVWEKFLEDEFTRFERLSLARGRGGFIRELVSFLLATGWYSIFSMATENELIAEIWNPAEVFPEYGDEGLIRCAHVYALPPRAIARKAALKGWKLKQNLLGVTAIKTYDYWVAEGADILNAIVIGNEEIKPLSLEPSLTKIPVYCSPVGGLPDRGTIVAGANWKKNIGQSIMAVNTNVYDYTNKLFTFFMQLLRDTAQARWVEKSSGEAKVKPEDIFKRGAVFHLGLGESLDALPMPPMPVELRAILFDVASMRQKGSLPDVLYGGLQQQISGYLMQQIVGASAHILRPYQQALKFLLEELCNDWASDIRDYEFAPYNVKLPKKELPRVEVDLRLEIPGDIVQRATVARMLDPTFSISTETVTDMLFPEIKNPLAEQAKVGRDRAMKHPIMDTLALIDALKTHASMLREAGDAEGATRYERAINLVQAGTFPEEAAQGAVPTPAPGAEALPREARVGAEFPLE